jgi:hypothetical protein
VKNPTPWHGTEAGYFAAIARAATRRRTPTPGDWTPPTGDTQWLVSVVPGEMTCLGCGETFAASSICTRCHTADEETGKRPQQAPPAVPTVSYLREEEYKIQR